MNAVARDQILIPRHQGFWPYLELARPSNLLTAMADVLAGFAIVAIAVDYVAVPLLLAAGVALYAGGVALNDAFDAGLDAEERPERPIPSGRVGLAQAFAFAAALLALGIACAWAVNPTAGTIALLIAFGCVIYDGWAKHEPILGPVSLGACRALNLLLGVSAAPALVPAWTWLGAVPLLYIAGITVASHGEVHGGTRPTLFFALATTLLVLLLLAAIAGAQPKGLAALPFLALFAAFVLPPLWRAYRNPEALLVRGAIRRSVLGLIALDAVLAAAFAGPAYALGVLALLPGAIALSRVVAVT